MRATSLFGFAATGLPTWFALLSPIAHAQSFDAVSIPDLDLSSLGRVTITGDFEGVSLYEYEGQSEITKRPGSSILTPLPNGILTNLTSADAQIRDMCSFTQKDGTFAGIFVGGNFSSLGGVDTPGAALFNPNSSKVTALPGLKGSVSTVLCDQDTNRVYVGGSFSYKKTNNALAWSPDDGWTELPFDGLNGPVESILKTSDGHIVFGGSFDGVGNSTHSSKNKKQVLNLQNATITSDTDSTMSGYSDNRNIICSTSGKAAAGSTYLLHDNAPGFWRADLGFDFNPTKVRLYNTHMDGRGTKSFLFRALPDNGIMNMTYTDDSGKKQNCDASCPLSDSTSEKYRDFTLVNPVGMQGFEIEFLSWYGQGAGLNGIEVFQDQIVTYAVDKYNEPSCAGIEYPATATRTGDWTIESGGYLSSKVTDSTAEDTTVVFKPDIKESGNYTVKIYTPGCVEDNTCGSRAMVNVTATLSTDSDESDPSPTTIYQTNNYDKYDTLFSGYVDAASDSFRPSVTLRPIVGQGDITVVASRVRFDLLNGTETADDNLNGLYDYDPSSKKLDTSELDKSDINKAGSTLKRDASIMSLAENDDVIYVAGNFSHKNIHNIMSIADGNATSMPGGGLNSQVLSTATLNGTLYVGGQFTDTSDGGFDGLNHVASYSFSSKKWVALGDGVNGRVDTIYPLELNVSSAVNETTLAVSGDFNKILAHDDKPAVFVPGFAIWIPSQKAWLQTLNDTQMEFAGRLSAVTSHNETSLLAGSLATNGFNAGGAVSLTENDDDLSLIPLDIKLDHSHTESKSDSVAGVITGVYDTESDRNLTILGGRFTTTASNGSTVDNVAFLNGTEQTLTGLPAGLNSNSSIISLLVHNETLYIGGNITGSIGGENVRGLVTYDMVKNEFSEIQPWSLRGGSTTVNAIAHRPGSTEVYVGGDFETAGTLPCNTVCRLDAADDTWLWPSSGISGSVIALKWADKKTLYAIGDMNIGGNDTAIATFSTKDNSWSSFDGASKSSIKGNVTAFAPASEDINEFWIAGTSTNGSAFMLNYDGKNFNSPGDMFSEGTVIRGMEILPVNQDHSSVSLLNDDQILLILGQLVIPNFGNASAALYNGTAVTPFILSSKSDGQPGSMAHLFSENENPYSSGGESHHSNGIVVLVAFCCALGCVFLIVAAGVILNKIQRRRQGYAAAPQTFGTDRPTDMTRLPPEYLFNSLGHTNPTAPAI